MDEGDGENDKDWRTVPLKKKAQTNFREEEKSSITKRRKKLESRRPEMRKHGSIR